MGVLAVKEAPPDHHVDMKCVLAVEEMVHVAGHDLGEELGEAVGVDTVADEVADSTPGMDVWAAAVGMAQHLAVVAVAVARLGEADKAAPT